MSKNKAKPNEVATILFALRYLQDNYDHSGIENSDHFEGTLYKPCTPDEINNLCECINYKTLTL